MSHLHDLHFSESILCHRLWDVFFSLLIQRSSFDRRQNPLGLYHPHPLFPVFSKNKKKVSMASPLLCLCGQSLGSTEVQTCQNTLTGTVHGSRNTSLTVGCHN